MWAVFDRASRGWRGVAQTPANVRLLQQLRRDLLAPTADDPTRPDMAEPVTRAASMQRHACGTVSVMGFSTSTCLPADAASQTRSACVECGVAMSTASMSGSPSSASSDEAATAPVVSAKEARRSGSRA